ncbi:LacI family DNA-binding transcriptional regulator [Pseudarthrobacter sp. alpha12b]
MGRKNLNAMPAGSNTTLADVAEHVGVSVGTVSKVINERAGVSAPVRERVREAIASLGYVSFGERNQIGPSSAEATIEVVADPEDMANPYLSAFLGGALRAATRLNAALLLRDPASLGAATEKSWAESLSLSGRLGVIEVTSQYSMKRERALQAAGIPMVLVDPIDVPRTSVPSVGASNWAGAYAATKHLLELGHTRIAYIGGPVGAACDVVRAHGWAAAMAEAGLTVDLDGIPRRGYTYEHGLQAASTLLSAVPRPTAIFAGSDISAMGVLEAARRQRILVPSELSVVGFDDTYLAGAATPPLTTVHQPIAEIGAAAVSTIVRLSRKEELPSARVELATELVVRASTAPPAERT